MGILGTGAGTVLTTFKSDSRQHRADLKKLSLAEKKRNDKLVRGLDRGNARMGKHIAMMGKAVVGAAALAGAYLVLKKGFNAYAERMQVIASGAGKNLDAMREASQGLISDTKLLSMESALLNGAMKPTGAQIVKIVKFMMALRKEGNDFNLVQKKMIQAFVELNSLKLIKFGVNIKAASGSVKAFDLMITEADKHIKAFGGNLGISGDNVVKTMTELKNATDDMTIAWGEFSTHVLPPVIDTLNFLLTRFTQTAKIIRALAKEARGEIETGTYRGDWIQKEILKTTKIPMVQKYTYGDKPSPGQFMTKQVSEGRTALISIMDEYITLYGPKGTRGTSGSFMERKDFHQDLYLGLANLETRLLRYLKATRFMGKDTSVIQGKKYGVAASTILKTGGVPDTITDAEGAKFKIWTLADGSKMIENLTPIKITAFAKKPRGRKSKGKGIKPEDLDADVFTAPESTQELMGSMRGPWNKVDYFKGWQGFTGGTLPEVDAEPWAPLTAGTLAVNTLKQAWVGMQDAAGAALAAVITGSGDFGDIFKKMTGEVLVAIAVEESVMAMREAALAVEWFFTPGGQALAAGHAEAAGLHLAAAAAAGVGARMFGSGSSAGAGAAPNTARGAASSRGPQTIILGADFETDSSRRRTHRLASMMNTANMTGAGSTVIEWA